MENKHKRELCKYCGSDYSVFLLAKHERRCYLNPVNAKKVSKFFLQPGLNRTKLQNFFKENSISIFNLLLDIEDWKVLVIKIILEYAKYGFIDLERYDLIIYKLTNGYFNYTYQEHLKKQNNFFKNQQNTGYNYELLYYAILGQAIKDLIILKEYDADYLLIDEVSIDKIEIENFIESFSPNLYEKTMGYLKRI